MSQSKSEELSFFNPNAVPLPENAPALYDIYLTSEGDLRIVTTNDDTLLGNLAPIQPVSVDEAQLVDGVLSLRMTNGSTIPLGDIRKEDTYVLPTLTGVGLLQPSGDFEPPVSLVPEVTIVEEESGFRVSANNLSGAKAAKRMECAIRRDYTGQTDSSVFDNTGMILNQWYPSPPLTFMDDPDDIGASLVAGKLVLPPGVYYVEWRSAAYRTNVTTTRLWSLTHQNEVVRGQAMYYTNNTDCSVILVHNTGYFKITEPTTIEVQARIGNVSSMNMFWSAHGATVGKVKDLLHLEIIKYPDDQGSVPEVKRLREVTRRMTSASSGNLTITSNSAIAGYEGWRALDSDSLADANKWASVHGVPPSPSAPHWLTYAFSDGPKRVTRYSVWPPATASSIYGPKSWELQGRNVDTDDWVTLDTVNGWTLTTAGSACVRDLAVAAEYAQYRLLITERNSGTTNGVQVGEWRLYEEY